MKTMWLRTRATILSNHPYILLNFGPIHLSARWISFLIHPKRSFFLPLKWPFNMFHHDIKQQCYLGCCQQSRAARHFIVDSQPHKLKPTGVNQTQSTLDWAKMKPVTLTPLSIQDKHFTNKSSEKIQIMKISVLLSFWLWLFNQITHLLMPGQNLYVANSDLIICDFGITKCLHYGLGYKILETSEMLEMECTHAVSYFLRTDFLDLLMWVWWYGNLYLVWIIHQNNIAEDNKRPDTLSPTCRNV